MATLILLPSVAGALDTVETWDVGATDLEFYAGYDGIGIGSKAGRVYSEMQLGYGIIERFSAYFGATLQANGYFADGSASLFVGIFGTPVDLDHFDLDLFLDVSAGGQPFSKFRATPSLEITYDADPAQKSYGFYLRLGVPVYGQTGDPGVADEPDYKVAFSVTLNVGAYLSFAEKHTVLMEYDMTYNPLWYEPPIGGVRLIDVGGVAVGYNYEISKAIKLITQLYLNIPQDRENWAVGAMIGFVATLPSPAQSVKTTAK